GAAESSGDTLRKGRPASNGRKSLRPAGPSGSIGQGFTARVFPEARKPRMAKRCATRTAWTLAVALLAPAGLAGEDRPGEKAPDSAGKIVCKEDLVYGRVEGAGLLADVAYPEGDGPFPVILSVHGGRWKAGSRTDKSAINVRQWAGFGFFAMSIDYRLVGCTPAPACYQDVLCALRWLHANAARYHIDRDRIFLIGQS